MARTKQRSRKPFLGRKKIARTVREVNVIAEAAAAKQPDPVAACSSSGLSATEKKLNFFGITLDSIEETSNAATGMAKDADDYYFIAQKSCLDRLIGKLLSVLPLLEHRVSFQFPFFRENFLPERFLFPSNFLPSMMVQIRLKSSFVYSTFAVISISLLFCDVFNRF